MEEKLKDEESRNSKKVSPMAIIWRRFKRSRTAVFGLTIFLIQILTAIFAPYIAPYDPVEMHLSNRLEPPNPTFLLGTDDFGRCILSRIIHGSRLSIMVGIVSVSIALAGGVVLGLVSGYYGGKIDSAIMRVMDILLAFPGIILSLLIVAILGPSLFNCMLAVGFWGIPSYARIIRGEVLSIKEDIYIESARSLGASDLRIIFKHILPNCMAIIIVLSTMRMPGAIMAAAGLSFLGLGAQPPTPEWGRMLSDGRAFIRLAPWMEIFPGLAIFIIVMGLNLLGDGLRDALDPRLHH